MFIDKKDLGLGNNPKFSGVQGVECTATLFIQAIDNNKNSVGGVIATPLSLSLIQKIEQDIISHYKEDIEMQLDNGQKKVKNNAKP